METATSDAFSPNMDLAADARVGPAGPGYSLGDSIELLRDVPDSSVHLILSDIPYGIGADDWDVLHGNTNSALLGRSPAQEKAGAVFKRRGKPINGWSEADANIPREYYEWCTKWAGEWLRVLKPGGSALVFAGRRYAPRCITALEDAGFNFRDMLAWLRPQAVHRAQRLSIVFERRGDADSARQWEGWRLGNLRPMFEPIIWCFKPYRITIADNVLEHGVGAYNQDAFERYFGGTDNVLECGMAPGEGGLHPTQKPIRLMKALIELTSAKGHLVLDPFAGSGSTLVAAKELGRRYLGFERDPAHVATIAKRLDVEQGGD
jgi:site-specific DNA-methyltransferase (adenine-specific)